MQELNLPSYHPRFKHEDDQVRIFDVIRKKYVACTPEEWVRQHFINFLLNEKNVPGGLMVLEKKIMFNTMTRRPDLLIYNNKGNPLLIVECKAPEVEINQDAFDQIARYISVIKAPFLVVTNGMKHYCCKMDHSSNTYHFLEDIPDYDTMRIEI